MRWLKFNGIEILEETTCPGSGQFVPIVAVLGDELEINGKLHLEGMVRHTKDAVRMQNFFASAQVQAIGIAKSGSWVAAEGQLEGREAEWKRPDPQVLQYKPTALNGTPLPPPQMVTAEPPIQAITEARAQFNDDLKAITGIYDAQLGARSNEQSGKAIAARKQQGEIGNYHFVDNLTRAIRYTGRVILDWIPDVYDTPRVLRIIGEDGEQKTVQVNQEFNQGGVSKIYDLTTGKYDVTVSAGPSYQTKRQEAADSMVQMTQAYPQLMQVAGDLLTKNLDWPGAKELSERLKAFIQRTMPGVIEDKNADPKAIIGQLQGQLQQMKQQHDAIDAFAKQLQQERDSKLIENQARFQTEQLKAQTQIAIEQLRLENQRAIAEITAKVQDARERMKLAMDLDSKERVEQHSAAHEFGLQKDQQQHEKEMAQIGHAQALEQQQQAGDQAMAQQAMQQQGQAEKA